MKDVTLKRSREVALPDSQGSTAYVATDANVSTATVAVAGESIYPSPTCNRYILI